MKGKNNDFQTMLFSFFPYLGLGWVGLGLEKYGQFHTFLFFIFYSFPYPFYPRITLILSNNHAMSIKGEWQGCHSVNQLRRGLRIFIEPGVMAGL